MIKSKIKYYSTNLKSPEVLFPEALMKGLAPDGGLYMPSSIPALTKNEIRKFASMEYPEIAFTVIYNLICGEIDTESLRSICRDAFDFSVPLEKVKERKYILRLDQGPTLSFKDFAARMMARLMHYYNSLNNKHFTILTATSGDTGSAVASAFHGLEDIDVIILFPVNEVSEIQRKQMTTLKKNIKVLAVNGKFDDCQRLVKTAFTDPSLSEFSLTSANSINIGRLIPQSVYYFYAWSKLARDSEEKVIFSVPSGNFGDLMGGILAREMGLPIEKMIIATNENNEVPEYFRTGSYSVIDPSLNCISSAMNVGHPSNLARIIALYGGVMNENGIILKTPDLEKMRRDFYGISVSDKETRETIAQCFTKYGVILEPHGAVGWRGMEKFISSAGNHKTDDKLFITLETAHPAKFIEEVRNITGSDPELPHSLSEIKLKDEEFIELDNSYNDLRDYIKKR